MADSAVNGGTKAQTATGASGTSGVTVPTGAADSAQPGLPVRTPEVEARFKELATELRCLVCQNQSLADSQAGLAEDLKAKVYQQIAAGKSDADIKTYMVERYGEFILYKPAFSAGNIALWIGPFVILLIAVIAARSWLKSNSSKPSPADLIMKGGQQKAQEELERLYRQSTAGGGGNNRDHAS